MLMTHREEYYQPRECDVICGRGKTFAGHPGNKIFLKLVRSSLKDYVNASGRFDRTLIVSHIAANFREYGVRFAQISDARPGTGTKKKRSVAELIKSFRFYEINDERKIHEKIGHAFRDMIRAQTNRSTTPLEEDVGSSPSSDADSVPSETSSEPTQKVSVRKKPKRSGKAQTKPKRKSQKGTYFTGIEKPQMTLNKRPGHQDNLPPSSLPRAFFEVEPHVPPIHNEKRDEESIGDDKDDQFAPDDSIVFNDSDTLAGLSFNSQEEPEDSHNDSSSNALGDSQCMNNIPERINVPVLVHWSKDHQSSDKRDTSDFPRGKSHGKSLESKYDADAIRWCASSGSMSIDPRRLLQEPLINDWHLNTVEYFAEFNPTNFDMSSSLLGSHHPCPTENKEQHEVHDDDDDDDDDVHHDSEGRCEIDV